MGGVLKTRWLVFPAALAVRLCIACAFFGSVDVTNSITDAENLIFGVPPSALGMPHLPGVHLLIWAAGILAFHTPLPLTFAFKAAGCLFDAVIAALVAEGRDIRAGWLYAFAPIPILIFAIHGQWDSICFAFLIASLLMLRRPGPRAGAAAGFLFVVAAIAKPIAVPFAPLLLEKRRSAAIIAGMAACFAVWCVVMWAIGDPVSVKMFDHVVRYARSGVTYFGAPFALGIQQNRLLVLLPMLVLLPLYALKKIEREDAILLFYAFTVATCGLSAQYLTWLVPFLLLCGHLRFAAVYSLLAGAFLITFYVSPFGGFLGYNFENLAAFAPLRSLAWLTPRVTNVRLRLEVVRVLGDWVIPAVALAFLVWRLWRRPAATTAGAAGRGSFVALGTAVAVVAIATAVAATLPRPSEAAFPKRVHEKIGAYLVERYRPPVEVLRDAWVIPLGVRGHPFAATRLAWGWLALWSVAAGVAQARGVTGARGGAEAGR